MHGQACKTTEIKSTRSVLVSLAFKDSGKVFNATKDVKSYVYPSSQDLHADFGLEIDDLPAYKLLKKTGEVIDYKSMLTSKKKILKFIEVSASA